MKRPLRSITVFTSNQPRHTALIERLGDIADTVWAVRECNTVFPGEVEDFFRKSPVMQTYFSRVIAAEQVVFGEPRFPTADAAIHELPVKMGDLNRLPLRTLGPALESEAYVVFGASYIKGPLVEHLVEHGALNIHMGVSPYYRGSSCNFWAAYDDRPDLVGATIHLLSRGLDSGPILRHALPIPAPYEPFELGMRAVEAAQRALVDVLQSAVAGTLPPPVEQDKQLQKRYTRNRDFTDAVAAEWLGRLPTPAEIENALLRRQPGLLLRANAA